MERALDATSTCRATPAVSSKCYGPGAVLASACSAFRRSTALPPAQHAPYHYVVETDVLPGHEDDLNAWYAQEHLPGLAAVPGTVRAARYVDASRLSALLRLLRPRES